MENQKTHPTTVNEAELHADEHENINDNELDFIFYKKIDESTVSYVSYISVSIEVSYLIPLDGS